MGEPANGIASNRTDLKADSAVRRREGLTFAAEENEPSEDIDTINRAVVTIPKAVSSLKRVQSARKTAEVFGPTVDDPMLSNACASTLTALV